MRKGYEWIACVAAVVAIAVAAVSMCSRECSGSAVDGGVEGPGGVAGALNGDDGRRGLAERLERIVAEYPGEIGVAVIFDSADTVAVNDVAKYPMMSVFKLHQAVALCADFYRRGVSPDTVLTIRRYELDPDTWSPMLREHTEKEFALPVRELMRYTLTQSDNNASNLMFRRLLGVGATDRFIATLIPRESFRIAWTEADMKADHRKAYVNATSPRGAAALIDRLFTDSLMGADLQRFLQNTLSECRTGTDRIAAPLLDKQGVTVAHKTGSGYSEGGVLAAQNDVAYVTLPDGHHYALAVFVKDFRGSEAEASAAIARISQTVYESL